MNLKGRLQSRRLIAVATLVGGVAGALQLVDYLWSASEYILGPLIAALLLLLGALVGVVLATLAIRLRIRPRTLRHMGLGAVRDHGDLEGRELALPDQRVGLEPLVVRQTRSVFGQRLGWLLVVFSLATLVVTGANVLEKPHVPSVDESAPEPTVTTTTEPSSTTTTRSSLTTTTRRTTTSTTFPTTTVSSTVRPAEQYISLLDLEPVAGHLMAASAVQGSIAGTPHLERAVATFCRGCLDVQDDEYYDRYLEYNLAGEYLEFRATVGQFDDSEVTDRVVRIEVVVDTSVHFSQDLPFNEATAIRIDLSGATRLKLQITLLGQETATLRAGFGDPVLIHRP